MRILYVSSLYPPSIGGAQIQLHCLAKAMKEAGHDVSALTFTSGNREDWLRLCTVRTEEEKRYEYEGIDVTRIGFPWTTRARMLPWAMAYYALIGPSTRRLAAHTLPHVERLAGEPSLIHLTRIGREFVARASLDLARKRGIPFVLTPNHHPRWRGRRYAEYDKIYREADAVIVYTPTEKQTLAEQVGVREERIHVTGVGPVVSEEFSADKFRADFGIDGPFILFLGQQYKYKGMDAVLKAAAMVWQGHPDIAFVFVGPRTNYSRELFQNVHDDRIRNLGAVDAVSKTSALAACEFLCMPSSQESFGGVYIEAWRHRKAVIGGRIPPIECVVDDGVNGLLTSQDPRELAGAIDRLLSNPPERAAMGVAGWHKLQDKYSWEQLARKTLAVYETVCS